MKLIAENSENPLKILIVASDKNHLVDVLKKKLKEFQADIFVTTKRVDDFLVRHVAFDDTVPNIFVPRFNRHGHGMQAGLFQ